MGHGLVPVGMAQPILWQGQRNGPPLRLRHLAQRRASQRYLVEFDKRIVAHQQLMAKVKHRAGEALPSHNEFSISMDRRTPLNASFGTTLTGELADQNVRVKPVRWR